MSEAPQQLDALAAALGRRAEQQALDERDPKWEAVAAGELALDDALADGREGDDDMLAAAYFSPFDADESAALVDGLLAQLGGAAGDESEPEPELETATETSTGAEVIPLRSSTTPEPAKPAADKPKHDPSSSGFWWIPGGMLVAAAAAIVVWWVWPPNDAIRGIHDDGPKVAVVEPLPSYVLETEGGLKRVRGGDTGGAEPAESSSHRYQRDTEFEWILRPESDHGGDVAVRGFAFVDLRTPGLPLAGLDELARVADSGAIRIAGRIDQLDLERGRYTIVLAVGRPADLPTQAAEVLEPAADAAWQVRRIEIEIED